MAKEVLYYQSDNLLEILSVVQNVDGAALTGATVTGRLLDDDGNEVTGQSWPVTLVHAGSGTYRATINDDVSVSVGQKLTAEITVDAGAGLKRIWEVPVIVRRSTS